LDNVIASNAAISGSINICLGWLATENGGVKIEQKAICLALRRLCNLIC
jgi:hypothetical protein